LHGTGAFSDARGIRNIVQGVRSCADSLENGLIHARLAHLVVQRHKRDCI
jgi:hypothetical protein